MVVPENVALAAYRREPEDRGVVEAWVMIVTVILRVITVMVITGNYW